MTELLVPISPGELIDKITILQIKSERMRDAAKLANALVTLVALEEPPAQALPRMEDRRR